MTPDAPRTEAPDLRAAAEAVSRRASVRTRPGSTRPYWVLDDDTFSALRAALSSATPAPRFDSGAMARALDANPKKRNHDETTDEGRSAWVCAPAVDAVGAAIDASSAAPAPLDDLREWIATKREVASEATLTYGEHATGFYDALGIVLAEIDRRARLTEAGS
jgi:hypothetical protein